MIIFSTYFLYWNIDICELDGMCEYFLITELKNINFQPLSVIHKMHVSAGRQSISRRENFETFAHLMKILWYNSINCHDL